MPGTFADRLSQHLNQKLLGQEEAVAEFVTTIAIALDGRPRVGRTKGMIFMAGPTGTGKTEMVKLTAEFLFGEAVDDHFHRFDMAEYQADNAIDRLLGAVGQAALLGQAVDRLSEAANRVGTNGVAFILFDEIEKAHKDLGTVLLALDAARITMNDGVTRDMSHFFVVVTSNVGSGSASELQHVPYGALRDEVLMKAEKHFRKETLARFDARIVMNRLEYEVQKKITAQLLEKEIAQQQQHIVRPIQVHTSVLNFLIGVGFTPDLGARAIRSTVERQIGRALLPWVHRSDDAGVSDRYSRTLILKEDRGNQRLIAVRVADEERSVELKALVQKEIGTTQLLITV